MTRAYIGAGLPGSRSDTAASLNRDTIDSELSIRCLLELAFHHLEFCSVLYVSRTMQCYSPAQHHAQRDKMSIFVEEIQQFISLLFFRAGIENFLNFTDEVRVQGNIPLVDDNFCLWNQLAGLGENFERSIGCRNSRSVA